MTVKDIVQISCTNVKIYVGDKMVYSPFAGGLAQFLDKRVLWIDAEDDILLIGIEGGDDDAKE